jgi:predicted DNA-binding transcriptional regulator AlpA
MVTATMSRVEELEQFLEDARKLDVRKDADFEMFMREVPRVLEMSESQIANALSVSRPTFNRWINGKNLPHNAMRKPAVGWVVEQLSTKLKHRKSYSRSGGSTSYRGGIAAKGA